MTALACDCVCGQQERSRVASTVDVAVLADPVAKLYSWELIKEEMASSNVIQRDSVLLATKLSPAIVKTAQDKEKTAKDVKLWALEARRTLVLDLLDCWVEKCEGSATVEALLTALSHPNFKDMKLRVEKMINMC